MNIFDQYGIKEVCDVTIYSIHKKEDGSGDIYYLPALYLDTLKVSTVEKTADNVWAEGGLGNARLINWDFGKEINLTLEDALCTPASLGMCWNGVLSSNWKDGHVEHKVGLEDDIDRLERMEKCFYPRGDRKSISQLLPQTREDTELIVENGDILTRSEVLDGIEADGFGEVQKRSFRWDLEVDTRIKSIAQIPRRFFDIYGRSHKINRRRTIGVAPYKAIANVYVATGKVEIESTIKVSEQITGEDLENTIRDYINKHHPIGKFTGTYKVTNSDKTETEHNIVKETVNYNLLNSATSEDGTKTDATITPGDAITVNKPDAGYKYYKPTIKDANIYVYKDVNNVNEDIKYSVYYKINEKEDPEATTYGTVIELDTTHLTPNQALDLIDQADYLQIRVLNDGTYHAGIILRSDKTSESVLEVISDYPFIDTPINIDAASATGNYFIDITKFINLEEFKHIDMWLTFDSLNEMTYYILTKFSDNIRRIIPKSLVGTNQAKGKDNKDKTEGQNAFAEKYERAGDTAYSGEENAKIMNKLWCYINPKTMTPYADDYWFHQGEPFYKKSLTLRQDKKKLKGKRIFVEAGKWPGMYRIVGETFMRARDTGEDERVQIEFPLAKIRSDQTLTLEADGDPTTFTMDVEVAQPKSGTMMIITPYEVEKVKATNDLGEEVDFDGSTQIVSE